MLQLELNRKTFWLFINLKCTNLNINFFYKKKAIKINNLLGLKIDVLNI